MSFDNNDGGWGIALIVAIWAVVSLAGIAFTVWVVLQLLDILREAVK